MCRRTLGVYFVLEQEIEKNIETSLENKIMLQKTSQYDPSALMNVILKAEVIDNVDPTNQGRVKVVIPKIMINNRPDESPIKKSAAKKLNSAKRVENKQDNQFQSSIHKVNFIWARPLALINSISKEYTVTDTIENEKPTERKNTLKDVKIGEDLKETTYVACSGSLRIPRIHTKVYVFFEDGDIKKCYYFPFGPTLESDYINTDTMENRINADTPNKRVNIDVIRTWQNGSMFYYDTNDEANVFCFKMQNGHRMKFEFNKDASGITINTESGHRFKMIDMSEGDSGDSLGNTWNQIDNNEEDQVPKGKFICLETSDGHKILMDDNIVNHKIHIITQGGHYIDLVDESSDTNGAFYEQPHYDNQEDNIPTGSYVSIKTKLGNKILMDDNLLNNKIHIKTVMGHYIDMVDQGSKTNGCVDNESPFYDNVENFIPTTLSSYVTVSTKLGNKVLLDDTPGFNKIHVKTVLGHSFDMVDNSTAVNGLDGKETLYNNNEAGVAMCSYIRATTVLGNSFIMYDKGINDGGQSTNATNQAVSEMGGTPGKPTEKHTKMMSYAADKLVLPFIRATTVGGNELLMSDYVNTIEINNAGGGRIKFQDGIEPNSKTPIDIMDIFTPGTLNITALKGINITSPMEVNVKGSKINLN